MNLQLFVKERLITSVPISAASVSNPIYLSSVKTELEKQFKEVIDSSNAVPTYNVVPNSPFYSRRIGGNNLPLL